ncbi:MAG: DUF2232 domain-containing protein [Deltaproteobacteria bacterium]|nr:DUF2232 domain-containing protein [Deltaproteobacteria bacterium]
MKITDVTGCAGSVILILAASAFLPVLGPFIRLLIPLPFLYYSSKLGQVEGIKTCVIVLLIMALISRLTGNSSLLIFTIEFSIFGLIISELFRRELSFGYTVILGTGLMLFTGMIFLFIIGLQKGVTPLDMIHDYLDIIQSSFHEVAVYYEEKGLDEEKIAEQKEIFQLLSKLILRIYPSLIIIGTGFITWVNIVVSKPLFRFGGVKYPDFGQLGRWQAPEKLIWCVIAAGFAMFLPTSGIRLLAENCLIVLSVVYFFNGLAIVIFFFNKYNIPTLARIVLYLVIIIQLIFIVILTFAGLFDQWADFRKIHNKKTS